MSTESIERTTGKRGRKAKSPPPAASNSSEPIVPVEPAGPAVVPIAHATMLIPLDSALVGGAIAAVRGRDV